MLSVGPPLIQLFDTAGPKVPYGTTDEDFLVPMCACLYDHLLLPKRTQTEPGWEVLELEQRSPNSDGEVRDGGAMTKGAGVCGGPDRGGLQTWAMLRNTHVLEVPDLGPRGRRARTCGRHGAAQKHELDTPGPRTNVRVRRFRLQHRALIRPLAGPSRRSEGGGGGHKTKQAGPGRGLSRGCPASP